MPDRYQVHVMGTERADEDHENERQTFGVYFLNGESEYRVAHQAAVEYAEMRKLASYTNLLVLVQRAEHGKWVCPDTYMLNFVDEDMGVTDKDGLTWVMS